MFKKMGGLGILLCAVIFALTPIAVAEDAGTGTDVSVAGESAPASEEALPAEEASGEGVVTGEVTVLDAVSGTITVKVEDGAEKAFSILDGETILWKGVEDIKLADIKKGEKAEIGYYTDDAGKLIASWVDVVVEESPSDSTPAPSVSAPAKEETVPEVRQPVPEDSDSTNATE